jgi:exodeoxyribonuclease V beta subunit
MLRRLLHDFGVPQRLLPLGDERRLTDCCTWPSCCSRPAQLLDGASTRWCGHLAEQRQEAGHRRRQPQLRLESDADLLKVVTVHKSKGLEYPLVFVPFRLRLPATAKEPTCR